jgi:hypothetical protein
MNTKVRYLVLAVLTISILLSLVLTVPAPLLYTLEKDNFPSLFHENVEIYKQQSINSTTDIAPELQDFIDFTGPVSLNIRIHDIEQARRDLERFESSRGSVKNLIVKLDMNESEIRKIEQNTALQKEILDSLLNTSATLDSLQLLEIQYNEQNNADMLTTVRLQGDEIRKRVRGLSGRYHNATEKVVDAASKLRLNVTTNLESQRQVDQIIQQIERPQTANILPVNTTLIPGEERISLFLNPDKGKYRDIIEYMGISLTLSGNTTLRAEGKPIIIYIDDEPVSTAVTDKFGYYNAKVPIERIRAGNRTVYSRSPTSRSVNRILTVIPVDSTTSLTVSKPDADGNVNCSGTVMANYPVRSAPVQISWDKTHVLVTKTDVRGRFMREIQLPPGRHTLIARFSDENYPINPSESAPQVVDYSLIQGPEVDYWFIGLVIFIIAVFLLFIGFAAYYLRRMTQIKIPEAGISQEAGVPDGMDSAPLVAGSEMQAILSDAGAGTGESMDFGKETFVAYYTRLLRTRGVITASWRVYQHLAGHIARDLNIKRHRTLTAREMSRTCRSRPYCGPFARFISAYERIRYGGPVSAKDQTVLETALHSTDEKMGGEDH